MVIFVLIVGIVGQFLTLALIAPFFGFLTAMLVAPLGGVLAAFAAGVFLNLQG